MSTYNPQSRLSKKEEINSYRKIAFFGLGTVFLIIALFTIGIPALIGVSSFLSSLNSTNDPITSSDTTSPFPPRLDPLQEATNSATVRLTGSGEPSSTIELFIDGNAKTKTIADKTGGFVFTDITLDQGKTSFYVKASDQSNNVSQPSNMVIINFSKKPPKIELTEPSDGATISNEEKQVKISGTSGSVIDLTINDRIVILNNDGSFTFMLPLTDGENKIKVVGTDIAGNQTTVERKVTFSSPS